MSGEVEHWHEGVHHIHEIKTPQHWHRGMPNCLVSYAIDWALGERRPVSKTLEASQWER